MPFRPDDTTNGPLVSGPALEAALRHRTWVRALAASLVGESSLADDVAQEAWTRVIASPPPSDATWRNWLGGVVRNVVRDTRRSNARRARREAEVARSEADESSSELLERVEEEGVLVQLVLDLDEPYRSVILRRYFDGWSIARIAQTCEAPEPTVRTRLRRGLAQLREALDKRYGGDRATWMSAVTALAAPVGSSASTGTLVIGGLAMATMIKVSAAVLVAAACLYFATRTPEAELPRITTVEPPVTDVEQVATAVLSEAEDPKTETGRKPVEEEPTVSVAAARGTKLLRVVLEGISEEEARMATVTLTSADKWPAEIQDSWPCQGLTSEFSLDPFFAGVVELGGDLSAGELEVEVDHPHHVSEKTRVSLSQGVELTNGKTVYEVRVRPVLPEFWPEFTLAVRDAHTGAHLDDIELLSGPGMSNSMWGMNPIRSFLADGLSSPVTLMGGRDANDPKAEVPYLGMRPVDGESPRLVKIEHYMSPGHGIFLYARAPGYAWGSLALAPSKSEQRELLLSPGSAIDLWLTSMQLERYRALETKPMLCVYLIREDGGNQWVHFKPLDETLETEGLQLAGLKPGGYRVTVELDGGMWAKRPVLAREELFLAAGETRELVLALTDPPSPPDRVTLGGMVSFPDFDGMEDVRLQLYQANWRHGVAPVELALAEMERVGGALPTWSFQLEDIPVGTCQIRLLPFLKNWMIDVPAGGRGDVALALPELAEVLIETVDSRTGERIPLEKLRYIYKEDLPGRVHNIWSDQIWTGFEGEPGLFRLWMAPGAADVTTWEIPSELGYASSYRSLELIPGLQSVRLELAPPCRIHFEFRVDGAAPRLSDEIWEWVHYGTLKCVRAVDHNGRARGRVGEQLTEVTAPGLYEISFEGLTKDRFLPIPSQRVDVREGETAEVIVELRRK